MPDFSEQGIAPYNPHNSHSAEDLRKAETHRKIDSLSQNYDKEWQMFQEPLQNAMDSHLAFTEIPLIISVTDSEGATWDQEDEFELSLKRDASEVKIIFDFNTNRIKFIDKGYGIPVENFSQLMSPYLSTKSTLYGERRRQVKGHAGIGIKSTIYNANYVKIESLPSDEMPKSCKASINVEPGASIDEIREKARESLEYIRYEILDGWTIEVQATEGKSIFYKGIDEGECEFTPIAECTLDEPGLSFEVGFNDYGAKEIVETAVQSWIDDTSLYPTSNTNKTTINLQKGGSGTILKQKQLGKMIIELYMRTRTYAGCMTTTLDSTLRQPKTKILIEFVGTHSVTIEGKRILFSNSINHEFFAGYHSPKDRLNLSASKGGANCSTTKRTKGKHVLEQNLNGVDIGEIHNHIKENSLKSAQGFFEFNLSKEEIISIFSLDDGSPARNFVTKCVNGMKLVISRSDILSTHLWLRPGCYISANGLLTRTIVPDTSFGGFDRAIHFVLDVDVTITPSKTDIRDYGPNVQVERRGRNQFFSDLNRFTKKIRGPVNKLAEVVATKEKKRKRNFSEKDKTVETDDIRKAVLRKWFNCLSEPITEQDVIVAFASYIAKKNYEFDWLRVSQDTNYDALCSNTEWVNIAKNKTNQPTAEFAYVEFKRNATDMIIQDDNNEEQNLSYPALIVSWSPVEEKGDLTNDYSFHTEEEDNEAHESLVYPDSDVFPRCALVRHGRQADMANINLNNHWAFVFSLESLLDELIDAENRDQADNQGGQ